MTVSKSKSCEREECDNPISPQRLKHNSQQRFCSRSCAAQAEAERRRENGFFFRLSQLGNAAQNAIAEQTGERPGHAKRSAFMKRHNALRPRTGPHKKWSKATRDH